MSVLKNGPEFPVYKALRGVTPFQQEVILKVFPKNSKELQSEWESLLQTSHLKCPVQLLGLDILKDKQVLILEFIKGVTLWELIQHYKLSDGEIASLMYRIHTGLKELAEAKLFHGDLSLSNILINQKREPRFIDFGKGNFENKGTFPFIAPEILKGTAQSFATNLFALGVLEFFLQHPHQLDSLKHKPPDFFISHKNPLLHPDPEKRHFPKEKYPNLAIPSLQHKIKALLHLKETSWQTEKLPPYRPTIFKALKKPLSFAFIWAFIGLVLNMTPTMKLQFEEGFLKIHTRQWFHVRLNHFKGYTPLKMPLSGGHYKLLWKSQNKEGEKHLYIPPGKTIVLNDRDLLPDEF